MSKLAFKPKRSDLSRAKRQDPTGCICGFCGKPNNLADDCGYFYVMDARTGVKRDSMGFILNPCLPACIPCYEANISTHQAHFGVGER